MQMSDQTIKFIIIISIFTDRNVRYSTVYARSIKIVQFVYLWASSSVNAFRNFIAKFLIDFGVCVSVIFSDIAIITSL